MANLDCPLSMPKTLLLPLAFFDLRPLILLSFLALGLIVCLAFRRKLTHKTAVLSITVVAFTAWFSLYGPFVGAKENMVFPMFWEFVEPFNDSEQERHVMLMFRDYPNSHVGMYSDDVAEYLESLDSKYVDVEFVVTTDYGKTRGFYQVRIGELTHWNSSGGHAGRSGFGSSPWP